MNKPDALPAVQADRRGDAELRRLFPDIVRCVAPFFGPQAAGLGGSLDYWAARAIRDRYPQLDAHEVRTLLNAAIRVHQSGEPFAES